MVLKCTKCNNTFNSTYVLEKHLNRKTPCDIILQCTRCDKVFKTTRELNSHANRKFPCKITDLNFEREEREKDRELKLKLIIEREREMTIRIKNQNELQLLLSREKNAIKEKENVTKQKENDIKEKENATKEKEIIAKENKSIREITARTANLQIQKEMLQIQYEGKLALVQTSEQLKLARKEKTATVINNNNIINITNNFITYVENTYFPVSDVCFTQISEHRKMIFNNMCHDPETDYVRISEECDNFAHLFVKHSTTRDMLTHVFTKSYNDPEYPDTRCVFYHKQNKQFYGMFITDGTKQLKPIDYDKDLRPEVSEMISRYVDKLNTHVPKRLQMHDLQNTQHYNAQNKLNETNACSKISDYQVSIAENVLCV